MKAFEIKVGGKTLDYRKSQVLNLDEVKNFFEKKDYIVKKIWQESRHVLGIIEKDGVDYFLKLATTEGIGFVTKSEYNWNNEFNNLVSKNTDFWVPKNVESGFYKEDLFYLITEYFEGGLFAKRPTKDKVEQILQQDLPKIIELSELIQTLNIKELSIEDRKDYGKRFFEKTKSWYDAVPKNIIKQYRVDEMLRIVENGYENLERKTRHGDFTPWHMIKLKNGKIGLIDGERALRNGVKYYDIGYLIQRIFSAIEDHEFAKHLFEILIQRKYNLEKLKVILASRAIGGFCDESLISKNSNFPRANKFSQWVLNL